MWSFRMTALAFAGLLAFGALAPSARAEEPSAAGLWQKMEDGKPVAWFLVYDHDGTYAGAIAKMFPRPGDDPNPACTKCSDDRKDQSVQGIEFIRGMKRNGLEYEDGNVLDPRSGKIWSAVMSVSPDGQKLTLHGYLGVRLLGQDDVWDRLPNDAIKQVDPALVAKYVPSAAPPPAPSSSLKPKGKKPPH